MNSHSRHTTSLSHKLTYRNIYNYTYTQTHKYTCTYNHTYKYIYTLILIQVRELFTLSLTGSLTSPIRIEKGN